MPLLLKTKKDLVKSFQAGGSTGFYATAGFNPVQRPIYNPGALLKAYKPNIQDAKVSKEKESKPAEFKFDGEGHKLDNEVGNQVINDALNKVLLARQYNRPESEINALEQQVAIKLSEINNAKRRSLELTQNTEKQVLGTDNKASGNLVFNNGNYFGTYKKRNPDNTISVEDKEMNVFDFADLAEKNIKLISEGKKPNEAFQPITYDELFRKRNNEYTSIGSDPNDPKNGDKIISTIASGGMGVDAAKHYLQETFAQLGKTDQSELKKLSERTDGVSSTSAVEEKYANNKEQLRDLEAQWKHLLDPKVKNALKREAWNNVLNNNIGSLPKDKKEREERLNQLAEIEYTTILKGVLNPKIIQSRGSKSVDTELDKLGSDDAGGTEGLTKLDHYMSDFLGEQKDLSFESFVETSKLAKDLKGNKNLMTTIPATNATSATGWVGKKVSEKEENHNIDVANGAEEDKARPIAVKFSELVGDDKNPSPFSSESLNNAVYITGDKISADIKARSIVLPGSDTDIVYMPVDKDSGKTIVGSKIEAKAIMPYLESYKSKMAMAANKYNTNKNKPGAQAIFYTETKAATDEINRVLGHEKLNMKIQAYHKQRMMVRVYDEDELNKETKDKWGVPFKPMDVMSKNYSESNSEGDPIVEPTLYNLLDSGFDRLGIQSKTGNVNDEDTHIYDALFPIPVLHEFAELSGDNLISKEELTIRHNLKKQSAISGQVKIK
jgi:hypothetical protein